MSLSARHSIACILVATCLCGVTRAGEWTHWRGPLQTGVATDLHLPSEWTKEGQNLLWHAPYGARTAPIVLNGRVYLITGFGATGAIDMQERVVALDLATGALAWEHRFEVTLTDIPFHRVGWANLCGDAETGNIYAHGVAGRFFCFDKDGHVLWSRSLSEDFGRISGYGGRIFSPIVDGDKVIIGVFNSSWGPQGKPINRFLAMDKRTGEIIWWSSPGEQPVDTTMAIPVVATLDGVRMLFTGLGDGSIAALKVNTGEPVWNFKLSKGGINASVLYDNGRVFASHSEENLDDVVMGRLVCLNARGAGDITATGEVWRVNGLGNGYATPVLHDGLLYVPDNSANLHCVDAQTGQEYWRFNYGNTARGSPVFADGKIYVGEMSGTYHILEVSKAGCRRLNQVSFTTPAGQPIEIYGTPAVVEGRVLLPTLADLYCIGLPEGQAGAYPPEVPAKREAVAVSLGAHLQIVPAETWISSGAAQKYVARAFDAQGEPIDQVTAEWSVKGLKGAIGADGVFQAEAVGRVSAGVVEAKAGALTAQARLRILPPLPYTEDFEALPPGEAPPGWITSKLKTQVSEVDGQKVLRKLAENPSPPFARLHCYALPAMPLGYTVQSDMLGQSVRQRFRPDMGLINAGYRLTLMGTTRAPLLRLSAWDAMPRWRQDAPFAWEPDRWYTMKMRVELNAGQALVRGKVWPRGETEPEAWTIEMTDPAPHAGGSPGLYAYSAGITAKEKGTEVLFDNVIISSNE